MKDLLAAARRHAAKCDFPAAVQILAGLLQAHPGDRDVLLELSRLSGRMGSRQDALTLLQLARRTHPADPELALEEAAILEQLGRIEDARNILHGQATACPDDPLPLLRLSYFLRRRSEHHLAEAVCRQLVGGFPEFAMGWVSKGISDYTAGQVAAAEASFHRALAIDGNNAVAHFSRAANLLSVGRWQEGFAEFEWRLRLPDAAAAPVDLPRCTGREPAGTRVLLWNDQGLGDAIQFLRYVPLIEGRGYRTTLVLAEQLVRLARTAAITGPVLASGDRLPPADVHLPLMSAPILFGTDATVPAEVPYLQADPVASTAWAKRLAGLPGRKVGLVWAGAPRTDNFQLNTIDQRRSIELDRLAPLLALPGIRFVSLQKGDPAAQLAALPKQLRPFDPMAEIGDFADTAALAANLDLVISVDTSVVHLAGALGKPVWVLSRFDGCWRWLKERDDSPWYPTARLFRQTRPGDWDGVIGRVAEALRQWAGPT